MKYFKVELDGVSYVEAHKDIKKGDFVYIHSCFGDILQHVTEIKDDNLSFKMVKYINVNDESANEESKNEYVLNGRVIKTLNRISKNQKILMENSLYTVVDIDKTTKLITAEELELFNVQSLYPVYNRIAYPNRRFDKIENATYICRSYGESLKYTYGAFTR